VGLVRLAVVLRTDDANFPVARFVALVASVDLIGIAVREGQRGEVGHQEDGDDGHHADGEAALERSQRSHIQHHLP
jgi:hypothetical protein